MPSKPAIVPFPSEAARKAKLFIPERYDPYQNQNSPRKCYFQYDQDNNALVLVADDTEELLDIFEFDDIVGASVEVELLGSKEPRASEAVIFEISTLEGSSREAENGIRESIGKDQGNVLKATYPNNAPTSLIPRDTQAAAKLTLFTYPRKDPSKVSMFSSCTGRNTYQAVKKIESNKERKKLFHRYACHHIFQLAPVENLDDVSSVVKTIQKLARPASEEGDRLLVIVNPFSGRKQGIEIFQSVVSPMLHQAGIEHDVIITTRAGHGEEAMAPKEKEVDGISDISKYTGLVAIGGDGSVYELFQGIRKRSDCEKLLQTLTLGHIGAGTSNGLSATLAHASKERFAATDYSFMVAKGNTVPMDLSRYETTSAEYLSFLTFSWSIIADVDIESEVLRWMGWLRMEVYTVWRVLNLRKYQGKLTYLPPNAKKLLKLPSLGTELDKNDGWVSMEENFCLFWVSQVSRAGEQMLNHPQSLPDDGLFHIFFIRGSISRFRLLLILLGLETGSHVNMDGVEFIECTAYRFEPKSEGSYNDLDGEVIESGPIQGIVLPSAMKAYCNIQP